MSTHAEKQRRYRERQRDGIIILQVEVNESDFATYLQENRLIDTGRADDRRALSRATSRYLQRISGTSRR
jgi:hypothetical protein